MGRGARMRPPRRPTPRRCRPRRLRVNAPAQVFGLPDLFGNGADGTAASPNGENGGLIFGSGGAGYNSTTPGVAGGNGGNGG